MRQSDKKRKVDQREDKGQRMAGAAHPFWPIIWSRGPSLAVSLPGRNECLGTDSKEEKENCSYQRV